MRKIKAFALAILKMARARLYFGIRLIDVLENKASGKMRIVYIYRRQLFIVTRSRKRYLNYVMYDPLIPSRRYKAMRSRWGTDTTVVSPAKREEHMNAAKAYVDSQS